MGRIRNRGYSASLTKGSLKVAEARLIAKLLLSGQSPSEIVATVVSENILQMRSPESSRTFATYHLRRLEACSKCLIQLVAEGSSREATQATLIGALCESKLLQSFMEHTLAAVRATGRRYLTASDWAAFMEWLESQEPEVSRWTSIARSKLRQNIWRILAEAEVVENTKSMKLQNVRLEPSVRQCLEDPSLSVAALALVAGGLE